MIRCPRCGSEAIEEINYTTYKCHECGYITRCGSEAIEEINYTTYKCHECGYIIRNPDDLELVDGERY